MFAPHRFETSSPDAPDSTFEIEKHPSANEYYWLNGHSSEDHGLGTQFGDAVQTSLTGAYVPSSPVPLINMSASLAEPADPTYRSAVERQRKALFGTVSPATDAIPVPSNDVFPVTEDHGPGAKLDNVIQTRENAQTAEAHSLPTKTQVAHSCLDTVNCQWTGEGSFKVCGSEITCSNVVVHLRDIHGIKKSSEDTVIYCGWEGCPKQIGRKNFVRHVREHHVGHVRGKKHPSLKPSGNCHGPGEIILRQPGSHNLYRHQNKFG
ncbi:hypothetical protein OG21DRAFT_1511349 [Imleria badia]|nr:hypothetical protein OG21DRAFT_1511349 [Imleria badia]